MCVLMYLHVLYWCVDMAIAWHVVGYVVEMLCHDLAKRIKCVITWLSNDSIVMLIYDCVIY